MNVSRSTACGDRKYLGFDVSSTVLERLRARFSRRRSAPEFWHVSAFDARVHASELALSLDVSP